ncbi:hypothetical protein [Fructilactobacillus florum]|uniref:hypothetical protein n=1 Tax=Fructilactobacillus florum TaxID=640331 RepID=UPI003F71E863
MTKLHVSGFAEQLKKIKADNELTLPTDFDGSFKHYRVVRPVKKTVAAVHEFDINKTNLFSDMLGSFSSTALNVAGDVSGTGTIMTTWLARDGYPFDVAVKSIDFASYQAHIINDEALYLINEGWNSQQTKLLLNQLGKHELDLRNVVIFVYSFKLDALLELENGLKQLDNDVSLLRRY